MSNCKMSIVIPVFNKWNFTKACLNDLFKLKDNQIIVVDNGSSDETQLELSKIQTANFTYWRNHGNLGFASACNQGFDFANSDNVLFLNNDIRVKSDWTDWTAPLIDGVQDGSLAGPTAGYVDPANNFQFHYETSDSKKKHNYMSGWCLAAKKETFLKLEIKRNPILLYDHVPATQIFSEEFGLAYFEDTDLGFRAKKLQIPFKIIDIPVVHFGKISSGQINTGALYSKARQIFIKKWAFKS